MCRIFSVRLGAEYYIRSDKVEAVSLYKSGVDIHSFQASAADIVSIADSDLFVFNGGSSDKAFA